MIDIDFKTIDPVFHSPLRIAVLSILVTNLEADFSYLKEATKASDGNLSSHLTKLEKAGFITIKKKFVGKKPKTVCKITSKGKKSLTKYISTLEDLIKITKEPQK